MSERKINAQFRENRTYGSPKEKDELSDIQQNFDFQLHVTAWNSDR